MTALATEQQLAHVVVITPGQRSAEMPISVPYQSSSGPAATIVIANDGDPHPELWPSPTVPVLVVLPPHSEPAAVLAAFAAGADACVRTSSSAEVTAHLGALLRRNAHVGSLI
jgi:hypothetical protein